MPILKSLIILSLSSVLISLICDGIIDGVGSVIAFVPELIALFFFIVNLFVDWKD